MRATDENQQKLRERNQVAFDLAEYYRRERLREQSDHVIGIVIAALLVAMVCMADHFGAF